MDLPRLDLRPIAMPTDTTILPQVLEYLVKKGYSNTERTLRQESAHLDKDGRPIHNRIDDMGSIKYTKAYHLLNGWIENNLDLYKASCIVQLSMVILTQLPV